jgi:hypothetical protein
MQLETTPYSGFPAANGYMHLEQVQRGETTGNLKTRFDNEGTTMSLEVLGGMPTEVFRGVAPGPHPAIKVPFVIARRKGTDARFISLLIPSKGAPSPITATANEDGTITVHGPAWIDTITLGETIRYHRSMATGSTQR